MMTQTNRKSRESSGKSRWMRLALLALAATGAGCPANQS